jgi:hypothetical protein
MLVCGCPMDRPAKLMLFDFEEDAELDRLQWRCFTLFSLSFEHAAHGEKSLKMEFFPSRWPGWEPKLYKRIGADSKPLGSIFIMFKIFYGITRETVRSASGSRSSDEGSRMTFPASTNRWVDLATQSKNRKTEQLKKTMSEKSMAKSSAFVICLVHSSI